MATVSLKDVRKSYAGNEVIHGVSIDVADGEFIVIVGPSGCGKSTLLRMVAGLEAITSGTIEIAGRVVNDLEPRARDIAMVFQNYALYPHMSVFDNMAYGLKIAGIRGADLKARVEKTAAMLELTPYLAPQAARALRRPAPARRHGPGAGPRPGRLPARRAALEPRRQAPRADAAADQGAAARGRHHRALRHPRPGRGDDPRRPADRDERRRRRADRHADRASTSARTRSSSPASSARRR